MDSDTRLGTGSISIEKPARPTPKPAPAAGGKGAGRRGRGRNPLARTGLLYREVAAEMRKVIWPTRREIISYTAVVLVFVTVFVLIISALDFAFTRSVLGVFG